MHPNAQEIHRTHTCTQTTDLEMHALHQQMGEGVQTHPDTSLKVEVS